MTTDLDMLGYDLTLALHRRVARKRRSARRLRVAAVAITAAGVLSAAAMASGIADDLGLDPAKWSILGGGDVDGGRAAYVHARKLEDGSSATFVVEHDASLSRYDAFLLHERALDEARATSPVPVRTEQGELCSREALTKAEQVALSSLAAEFAPGTPADATKDAVDAATAAAFAGSPCRGLEYAGEQARLVYAGKQPRSMLMPGAR
ncbi:MAG TPA: hypothetical protein VFA66_09325 [Gaiellaceae bacterium]|nr:hypothetical protein [Gaiellaceae bacterium]